MTTQPNTSYSVYFPNFWKRLTKRTLLLQGISAVVVAVFAFQWLGFLLGGFVLSWVYLWSLRYTSEHPDRKLALGWGMARMLVFAVLVTVLGHGEILPTTIVIAGCFSYKMVLLLDT